MSGIKWREYWTVIPEDQNGGETLGRPWAGFGGRMACPSLGLRI